MRLPSRIDGRPDVKDEKGNVIQKCHDDAGNPLRCGYNGGDVPFVVPLTAGGWGVLVHSWVRSGGIPGVHTICGVCGGGGATADACGIGWPCDPKGVTWPAAINETPTRRFSADQAAALAKFSATKVSGGRTLADFLPPPTK